VGEKSEIRENQIAINLNKSKKTQKRSQCRKYKKYKEKKNHKIKEEI
jgi:hypothetical protein